jgi:hypothetical protein
VFASKSKEAMKKLEERSGVSIERSKIIEIIEKVFEDNHMYCLEDAHVTEEYVPEIAELFMRDIETPLELERLIENFIFKGDLVWDIEQLHKELGIYDRKDWIEEMDKYCPECGEIYPNEDPKTESALYCSKCGTKLETNNGL